MARFMNCQAYDGDAWRARRIAVDDIARAAPCEAGTLLWLAGSREPLQVDLEFTNVAALMDFVVIDDPAAPPDAPADRLLRDTLDCLRALRGCTVGATDIGNVYLALRAATAAGFTLSRRS